MPALNGYSAHIALLDKPSRHIKEYGRRAWADGITVSCFIPATTGKFFMGKWSVSGHRKGVPYSVEFIRDGESVNRLLFDEDAAKTFHGGHVGDYEDPDGKKWYYVFREFTCAGEDNPDSKPVPDYIGVLQIVIRDVVDGEMDEILPSNNRAASEGAEHEGYKRAQALYGGLQDNHNTFTDWHESKPRHTHQAEMVQGDGTIWKNRVHPLNFLPKSAPGEDKNVVACFTFYYTSPERVNGLASRGSQPVRPESESDDDICLLDGPPPGFSSPVKNEPKAELESVNVRSPSVAESLRPVKTEAEKEKEKEAELMRCLKKYKALGDKIRLLSGQPVEGDESPVTNIMA